MKKAFNELIANTNIKYLLTLVCLVATVLIIYALTISYSNWQENQLIAKYSSDPEKKQFIEMLQKDRQDLSANPERARRIGITMDMGLQWYSLLQYELAAKWWKRGLSIEENNDVGWYNLGNAYRELRQFSNAEKYYRKSMEVATPGEIDGCLALGEIYRYAYTSKKDREPYVYLECLEKHKDNRDLIARLAIYYRDSGDVEKAVSYFDKLFSIEPTVEISEELRQLRIKQQQ